MAATECGHGHIYDSDLYAACPYCNSTQPIIHFDGPAPGFGGMGGPTVLDGGKTAPIGGGQTVMDGGHTAPVGFGPTGLGTETTVTEGGHTLPPRDYIPKREKRADEDAKTQGGLKRKLGIDPVGGWLGWIEGGEEGKDYRLLGRINTIGRGEKSDVRIQGDPTISHVNHARVGYGEKNNRFTLIPADGSNVIYLNGEEVYTPVVLEPYDVIDFGQTKLVFIPLCSKRFRWSEGVTDPEDGHGTL